LWCGVYAVGVLSVPDVASVESAWSDELLRKWHELLKNECEYENKKENDGTLNESVVKCCVHNAMKDLCRDVYNKTVGENKDLNAEGICKEYIGKADDAEKCPEEQPNPVHDTGASVRASDSEAPGEEGGSKKTPEEEGLKVPPQASPAKPAGITPSPPVALPPVKAEKVPEPISEKGPVDTERTNDLAEEEIVPIAENKRNETSNGQAESATPTPPVSSDDANNETDTGTGGDIPNNALESDVAGTEEKQDENKENNTNETTLEADAVKN
ncbi:mucin-associated surface protein (MASP), putative, partial [Trypanosoma cruzi marinkellei]